jgi:hypothetical protein
MTFADLPSGAAIFLDANILHANPSRPGGVVGVTQSTESRCINGGIGDWYGPSYPIVLNSTRSSRS